MIPHPIKVTILELSHQIWNLCNIFLLGLIYAYYYVSSSIEQANKNCDTVNNPNLPIKDLRTPKHIALSFTNEQDCLDLDAIARLLCWCRQLSIRHITLYDDLGRLKDQQKELFKHIEFIMKSFGCEKPVNRLDGLNIISKTDGREKFLSEVKEIVMLKPDSIDLETVNSRAGWPSDPDLLISFGSPLCLYGFPPWQLRLTEILSLPTHRKLPRKVFTDCLIRYSRISQREGA